MKTEMSHSSVIDRGRLEELLRAQEKRFVDDHPQSYKLYQQAKKSLLAILPTSMGASTSIFAWATPVRWLGTLLIIDETHTICTGPGGYTKACGLKPDILTLGKPIAGGIPAAVYGFSEDVAQRIAKSTSIDDADVGGIGGTLAGNALSLAAMRATLQHVLTEETYKHMIALADRFVAGVQGVIDEFNLPWIVKQLGCRAEYWFRSTPPLNGAEAAEAVDAQLDRCMHLAALNRGILMTPFHNMALMSPATSGADIVTHTQVFRQSVVQLVQR